jgi:hypothetical protein
MASQDQFEAFLDNIEPSSTETNTQKAHTGLGYLLGGYEVDLEVRA